MSPARLLVPLIAVAAVAAGCGSKRPPATAPVAPPPPALVVLLPDPESNITGRARVANEFGGTDLASARAATRVIAGAAPPPVTTMSEAEVRRVFGQALDALPPPPRHFTLQFRFESDALTEQSSALIPEILAAVKALAVPEVIVIGHTDTMGDAKSNVTLGLKRGTTVRGILIGAGLPASTVEVVSHGEGDLLVKTRNNVPEPRNRRVEITVR